MEEEVESIISVWRCDYCQTASFGTFEKACEHEEQCKQQLTHKKIRSKETIRIIKEDSAESELILESDHREELPAPVFEAKHDTLNCHVENHDDDDDDDDDGNDKVKKEECDGGRVGDRNDNVKKEECDGDGDENDNHDDFDRNNDGGKNDNHTNKEYDGNDVDNEYDNDEKDGYANNVSEENDHDGKEESDGNDSSESDNDDEKDRNGIIGGGDRTTEAVDFCGGINNDSVPVMDEFDVIHYWHCDVCEERFISLDEATEHERICALARAAAAAPAAAHETKSATSNFLGKGDDEINEVHPFFQRPKTQSVARQGLKQKSRKRNPCINLSQDSTRSSSEADEVVVAKKPRKQKNNLPDKNISNKSCHDEVVEIIDSNDEQPGRRSSLRLRKPPQAKDPLCNNTKNKNYEKVSAVRKAKISKPDAPLASIFAGCHNNRKLDKNIVAEQHLVEFQAKRRLMEQKERERQEKRQRILLERKEQKIAQQSLSQPITTTSAHHGERSRSKNPLLPRCQTAPSLNVLSGTKNNPLFDGTRFPIPSHFTSSDYDEVKILDMDGNGTLWLTKDHLLKAQSLCSPALVIDLDSENSEAEDIVQAATYQYMFPPKTQQLEDRHNFKLFSFDDNSVLLDYALSSLLVPPCCSKMTKVGKLNEDGQSLLWVDKYCTINDLGNDICGESLQQAAKQLGSFIQQWMIVRQKANARMEARQKQFATKNEKSKKHVKKKTKVVNTKKSKYDDDLWDDDWDSDDDETNRLGSLFLMTGPVGCGKSGLVHAVAKSRGCKVLEINTSHQRGAVGLKKMLLEATQSHSSMDMLNKQKKREINLFQARLSSSDLADTDSEMEDEEVTSDGTSLTVVLIDEVDLMYEEDGDNGFWPALSDLCKRSKCPVILTANRYPKQLDSITFQFNHVEVNYPSPSDCVPKLRRIIQDEGFMYNVDIDEATLSNRLEEVVELAGCDLRRLILQIESMTQTTRRDLDQNKLSSSVNKGTRTQIVDTDSQQPHIQSVEPHGVLSNVHSIVTIKGSNFLSLAEPSIDDSLGYDVNVYLGDKKCPCARILNDSTIISVCAPLKLPAHFEDSGHYRGTRRRSIHISYTPINVSARGKKARCGILSTSSGTLASTEYADGSILTTQPITVNLEYHFPGFIRSSIVNSQEENSDEECEFGEEVGLVTMEASPPAPITPPPIVLSSEDDDFVMKLLAEAIDSWCLTNGPVSKISERSSTADQSYTEMDNLAAACGNASDAVLLDDYITGTPFLSGSCRGFGFELTEEYPKRTNENSKPPSEERLYSNGWKEYSYFYGSNESHVTKPCTAREKTLLKQSVRRCRGLAYPRMEERDAPLPTDEDGTDLFVSGQSDEDALLPNDPPASLSSLPIDLMQTPIWDEISPIDPLRVHFINRKREAQARDYMYLLRDYILPWDVSMKRQFFDDTEPELDRLFSSSETMDPMLFLDYLPMLRSIGVFEFIAEFLYEAAIFSSHSQQENNDNSSRKLSAASARASSDDDVRMLSNRRFNTRRAKKLGRHHYMEKIIPDYIGKTSILSSKEIGNNLAKLSLMYKRGE